MRFQRSVTLLGVAGLWFAPAEGLVDAPYSGIPFEQETPLGVQPSPAEDAENTEMIVHRLLKTGSKGRKVGSPHLCDMGDQADKEKCLSVEDRGCMWTRLETQDPLKPIQASNSYCLPCRLDEEEIPCWNPGAWVNGMKVMECTMSCMHQQRIWQPEYACSDDTGFISQAQCFSRGAQSGSKCMFIAYEDKEGNEKGGCGPCQLSGSGGWGCPKNGDAGPEDGSKVKGCVSQCDVLCAGPPACPPTVAPPPPPPPPSPGITKVAAPADEMLSAPAPFAFPKPNPYAVAAAIEEAAKKAGWKIAPPPVPKTYWPVIYYRNPMDYMFTTGPPPDPNAPPGPSGLEIPTEPPMPEFMQLPAQQKRQQPFLRSLRRRSWGQ